ncbi:MAG: oligosaccharide flippase family protein [Balneolaceae bacterium]|jgi:O-antigen/teichoic acid export membrane protein
MGIIVRQSVINSIISYVGVALGFVITIWLYPNFFTTEQYGLTRVLLSLSMVLIQVSSMGINSTIIRYFPFFRNKEKNHHGFLTIILLIPLVGFIIFGLLLFLFKGYILSLYESKSELLLDYYLYLFPLAFFILFFKTIESYTYALYNTVASSFLHDIFIRLLTIAILFAYLWGWINFQEFMMLFVINYGINLVLLSAYLLTISEVKLQIDFEFLDNELLKKMLNYGAYSFFGSIATVILGNIDILMLGAMVGLGNTGIYAIAFYIGSAIKIPRQSILKISAPIVSDAIKNDNYHLVANIYKRSSLNLVIAGGLLFCGIVANLHNLNEILPSSYAGGTLVIITVGFANYFEISTGINGAIIINSKHFRFDLYSTIALIVLTVVLNYLFIPVYGILGAAIGTATAIVLYNMVKVFYVWKKFSMHPFNIRMIPAILITGITLFLALITSTLDNPYWDILLRSISITVFYIGIIRLLNLSEDLNKLIHSSLKRFQNLLPI